MKLDSIPYEALRLLTHLANYKMSQCNVLEPNILIDLFFMAFIYHHISFQYISINGILLWTISNNTAFQTYSSLGFFRLTFFF